MSTRTAPRSLAGTLAALALAAPLALVPALVAPRAAEAGLVDTALELAGPLASQFGVPVGPITSLLEGGVSLESVAQLLLITQSSGSALDSVTSLFGSKGNDVMAVASELGVAESVFGDDQVKGVLDTAKKAAADAAKAKAASEASKAIGGMLGGGDKKE